MPVALRPERRSLRGDPSRGLAPGAAILLIVSLAAGAACSPTPTAREDAAASGGSPAGDAAGSGGRTDATVPATDAGGSGGAGVASGGTTGTGGTQGSSGSGGAPATGGSPGAGGSTASGGAGRPGNATGGVPAGGQGGLAADGGGRGDRGGAAGGGTGGSGGAGGAGAGGPLTTSTQHLDIGVHDPSMIWDGKRYYLFATGGRLGVRSSANILQWSNAGQIFTATPAWVTTALGADPGDLWAPDVSFFNGAYHVYYAGSTFGSNSSVIGLATNTTLDPAGSGYKWVDQGLVVQSRSSDDFNAIDPNLSFDAAGTPWLAFGSFWTGIKLRKIDAATGKLATDDTTTYALAARGTRGAIEAASIVSHNGFYYLFVSFDTCCKGVDSTYRTMVGRASKITGPYTDKAGQGMSQGAAVQLLASSGRYIGPGGGTAFRDGDAYVYVFHYYDGQNNGASKLQVRPITFSSDDWPALGEPLFP